tara:strand:+ start:1790 stop:2179 length:390 start_codon:yes stop_codon:yes gene_type:complete
MPSFGKRSKKNLDTCHPYLQLLFNEVVKDIDCSVICGHRTKTEQHKAFDTKKSKTKWPDSKHNESPAMAVDVVPYPVDWGDLNRFYFFAGFVLSTANRLGLQIRFGGDWDSDMEFGDNSFNDLVHFELM